jgi:hypothetical protein
VRHWLWPLALVLLCGPLCRVGAAAELARIAVVVGANRAPAGRVTLRYAHEDARRVADVLSGVAGFAKDGVKVLLDPEPKAVLAALDAELAAAQRRGGESLLFFYYSGHADDRSIFPAGLALPFSELKLRLEDTRAKLRIGLIDSCRGGSWTGSKGLKKVEPFEISGAQTLAEEGSVLIASSTGQENAHETEALRGSFFTHYWNAGLRGAADRSGDGVVSLGEAFEYARSLTIKQTALAGQAPQHPSFQMKLSGRRDFPLVSLINQRTTLVFEQSTGPVEVVRLSDGLVVVESTPGARRLRLGLASGSYLVRRRTPDAVWARVVSLSAGGVTSLAESELERTSLSPSAAKDAMIREASPASWATQRVYASVAGGVRHAPVIDPGLRLGAADGSVVVALRASVRLTRHLWLAAPLAAVFDAERESSLNWFAWAGVPTLGGADEPGDGITLRGFTAFGADLRYRQSAQHTFNATLAELGAFTWTENGQYCAMTAQPGMGCQQVDHRTWPTTWATQFTLGISESVPGAVTFNLGAGIAANLLVDGSFSSAEAGSAERNLVVALGSIQRVGLRTLPLIHVLVGQSWGIDVYAVGAYLPAKQGWVETYMGGISYEH